MVNSGQLTIAMVVAVTASIFALPTVIPAGTQYTLLTITMLLIAVIVMLILSIK